MRRALVVVVADHLRNWGLRVERVDCIVLSLVNLRNYIFFLNMSVLCVSVQVVESSSPELLLVHPRLRRDFCHRNIACTCACGVWRTLIGDDGRCIGRTPARVWRVLECRRRVCRCK